jgi:hypothetical protein
MFVFPDIIQAIKALSAKAHKELSELSIRIAKTYFHSIKNML